MKLKEFAISDWYKKSWGRIAYKGEFGTFCPRCFAPQFFELDADVVASVTNKKHESPVVFLDVNLKCSKCGEHFKAPVIDPNITRTIALLNQKGYTTSFCCEGHTNGTTLLTTKGKDYEVPDLECAYILFKHNYQREIVDYYPLPPLWHLTASEYEFYIIDAAQVHVNADCDFGRLKTDPEYVTEIKNMIDAVSPHEERVKSIYKWADLLPPWGVHVELKRQHLYTPEHKIIGDQLSKYTERWVKANADGN